MDGSTSENWLPARRHELLAPLTRLADPQARLSWLVERARRRPLLAEELRIDRHRVQGCVVRLWWVPGIRDGRCWFAMDSDAASLKAVVGLLCDFYSGATPEEIVACPPTFLERLGLAHQLAENRRATVGRVAAAIHEFARQQLQSSPANAESAPAHPAGQPT